MSDIADSIAKTLREAGVVDRKPTLGEVTGAIAVELTRIDERLKKLEMLRDIEAGCEALRKVGALNQCDHEFVYENFESGVLSCGKCGMRAVFGSTRYLVTDKKGDES